MYKNKEKHSPFHTTSYILVTDGQQDTPILTNNQVMFTLKLFNSNFSSLFVRYCIFLPFLLWIIWFPSTCGKDMLVAFVP